jgi:ferredoxin
LFGNFYTKYIIHGRTLAYPNSFQHNLNHSKINFHIVLEHENALKIIRKESDLCVVDCMCRLVSKNCESPLKTCILVGPEARRRIKKHPERRFSAEQATHLLQSCFEKNLIHNAIYVLGYLVEICNCCKCCCLPIIGVKKGFKSLLPSDFIAVKSDGNCMVCGICEKNCPFDAIINGRINTEKCYGCGLCSYKCPERVIKMVKK